MSSAGGSMQRRRYTITTATQQKNEYPEHLNPFHEENEDGKTNNRFSSLGRRNSRLTASLRLKSWFPSKSSKPDDSVTDSPTKPKEKFLTLTPKISRQIKDVFNLKRSKNKSDSNLQSIPQYVPIRKPNHDHFVGEEFKLAPRASRERFATPSKPSTSTTPEEEERRCESPSKPSSSTTPEEEERRCESPAGPLHDVQPPVPLPRTILPKVSTRDRVEGTEGSPTKPPKSPDGDAYGTSSEVVAPERVSLKISEEDKKYVRQGARPKKKRQAPLPPTRSSLPTSCKTTNETDLSEGDSQSATINSDCPSLSPEPLMEPPALVEAESPPPSSPSPTDVTEEDRLI